MRVVAIIQARMGSTRFPKKVMKLINTIPMIEVLLSRISQSKLLDEIVVATTNHMIDRELARYIRNLGYACVQGSEKDVLDRYLEAAQKHSANVVVRITGDCPLVDPELVDICVDKFFESEVDYCSNICPATFPDGLDIEVFTFDALMKSKNESSSKFDHEHVTPYLRNSGRFVTTNVTNNEDLSGMRWTVDEIDDLEVIKNIFSHFYPRINFGWKEVLELYKKSPELFSKNFKIKRNEGILMGTGQKLCKRAKRVIPGGNMLLSKRAEMFLPDHWPAYFSKAKGCQIWDMDGNQYTDMSLMGVGTNILGYGHHKVDEAVEKTVLAGNMSTLNCPEEVYLAEKLIELHPWAEMVRFARSGGEANSIGIRIARAVTGKDNVAICGYHGWHDWYLSSNLNKQDKLDGHLLPGLEPNGVPKSLQGTVFPFSYNNFSELENIVNEHDIGVIKMEVLRNHEPENNFLQKIRTLADERGIVLIFDECTSGFRETIGGLHKIYGVDPDMAIFGKALGNGYAITAVIGKREVMEAAQTTFISSTFWTERIGPSAALKTLEVMEAEKSWEQIKAAGLIIRERWQQLADSRGIQISISGLTPLPSFTIDSPNFLAYKTLITQEMLAMGYLAGNSVYVCTEHTPKIIDDYCDSLDSVFRLIQECEQGSKDIISLLKGPVCHSSFKRLN